MPPKEKYCPACDSVKQSHEFCIRNASKDGLNNKCRTCAKEYINEWRKNNPDAHKRWYAENRHRKSEYFKKYREKHKDRLSENYQNWARNNKHKVNALIAKRNAAKKNATPSWADLGRIHEFYERAERITKETGIRHEVDHIYPIQGEIVCGLHVHHNLQILTKSENIRKHNKMPEDMK